MFHIKKKKKYICFCVSLSQLHHARQRLEMNIFRRDRIPISTEVISRFIYIVLIDRYIYGRTKIET
jgi:hypothetical protein